MASREPTTDDAFAGIAALRAERDRLADQNDGLALAIRMGAEYQKQLRIAILAHREAVQSAGEVRVFDAASARRAGIKHAADRKLWALSGEMDDQTKTGDRYTVETRLGDCRLALVRIPDPFINTRVVIGWRDLLRGLLRRKLTVNVVVGGDGEAVEDVLELNSDYLGHGRSTRRRDWDAQLEAGLRDFAAIKGEHEDD